MNKHLKKLALAIPQVKRYHDYIRQLEFSNSGYEFRINQLSSLFDTNVDLSWEGEDKRDKWVCMQPFERFHISEGGTVRTCCPTWVKDGYPIGNALIDEFEQIWNSDKAKRIRFSASRGQFEYCDQTYCPVLQNPEAYPDIMKDRTSLNLTYNNWQECWLKRSPKRIHLACDATCNLYCESCRPQVRGNNETENKDIYNILEHTVRPALSSCELLSSLGSGEFFASKPIQRFYQTLSIAEFPSLQLNIITNGTLFTQKRWDKLSNLKGMVNQVAVSVDAATKEKYEKFRRGAKWDVLCDNMNYISSLAMANEIKHFSVNFVVRDENFMDMERFVDLAVKWGVSTVNFQRIKNYGSYTSDFHTVQDVFHPDNKRYKEARQILSRLKARTDIRINDNCVSKDFDDLE